MVSKFYKWICLFSILFSLSIDAETPPQPQSPYVSAKLIAEDTSIQPGHPTWVALHLKLADGWHVYWKNPGDAGVPVKIEWQLPSGIKVGELEWPYPEQFDLEGLIGYGYHNDLAIMVPIIADQSNEIGQSLELKGNVEWLVCSDSMCQPGSQLVSLLLPIKSEIPHPDPKLINFFEDARRKIPKELTIKSQFSGDGIEIQMNASDPQSTLIGVNFFPEQQGILDLSHLPTASKKEDSHVVNLKLLPTSESILKGVLVLHTEQEGKRESQSFAISALLDDNEEIAEIDQPSGVYLSASSGSTFQGGLGLALVFAFVGGMILNLMPCVLPVLSFKILSLVKMSGQSRALRLKHSMLFSFGVLLSFWILAGLMLGLRSYGQSVGWGFQLQEPLFVAGLATLLFVFALSLFGLFELGMGVASLAGDAQVSSSQKSENLQSFFSGILATAVATPCTGPFLGSAVGFAVTLPVFQGMLIFTLLALGLCFPYLVLALFPALLRFLPRPGPWMETFKQLMGFILLATVLWLLWVFSAQTSLIALMGLLGSFLFFSVAAWIYGQWATPVASKKGRFFAYALTCLFVCGGISLIAFSHEYWYNNAPISSEIAADWEPFSPERVEQLQKQGVPVLVDFTAKWCLICQANHLTLCNDSVSKKLDQEGVVRMKADWTRNDPIITAALSQFGRNSVPLYVLYGTKEKQEPQILPQVLTSEIVLNSIDNMKKNNDLLH